MKKVIFFTAIFLMIGTAILFVTINGDSINLIGTNDSIYNIEHIENVDEMKPTPQEIYFFTDKGKYHFDGKKVQFISTY